MNKKRLGIFVFYNIEGKVEDYIIYLLDSINKIFEELIIVVNGKLCNNELERLRTYSENIFFRSNIGFDGGAYKEAVTKYLGRKVLNNFNQCVLFNSTFCGPFHDWNNVFLKMESVQKDFWGLSKWIGGYSRFLEEDIPEHVQAYFQVIEQRMLHSEEFMNFWDNMQVPESYGDAIKNFEVEFTQYFGKKDSSILLGWR